MSYGRIIAGFRTVRARKNSRDTRITNGIEPRIGTICDMPGIANRHYLHDDLSTSTLQPALIQAPPIELWPAVVARLAAPADVDELLKPIRAGMQGLPPTTLKA